MRSKIINEKDTFEKYFILGYFSYYKNDFDNAKKYFEEAMKYIDNEKNLLVISYNGQFLANCWAFERNYEKANEVYNKICKYIPKNQYSYVYKPIMNMAKYLSIASGKGYIGIGKLECIKSNIHNLSSEIKLELYKNYYECYSIDKNYSMVVKYILKAIKLAEKLGDKYSLAQLTGELGSNYCEVNDYRSGEKSIIEAFEMLDKSNDENVYLKHYILMKLVKLYEDTEQHEKALKTVYYMDYLQKKNKANATDDFINMQKIVEANVQTTKEHFDLAEKLLSDVNLKNKNIITETYTNYYYILSLGDLNLAKCNYEKAIEYYKECLKLSHEFDRRKIKVYEKLINTYHKIGDDKSRANYQKLLIEAYKEDEFKRNEDNRIYIVDNLQKEDELIKSNDRKIIFYKSLMICIITVSFVISFLIKKLKSLKKQTIIDGLTRIYNRRFFDYQYYKAIARNENISVIMIDIDDFKKVNDMYGHDTGDLVLKNTAKIIDNLLDNGELLFRYGGEEFCILVKNKHIEYVIDLAENIRSLMEMVRLKDNLKITLSLGIGVKSKNKDVLKLADENLYIAKNNGKNRVVY